MDYGLDIFIILVKLQWRINRQFWFFLINHRLLFSICNLEYYFFGATPIMISPSSVLITNL